jgi:hypothetical protein
VGLKEGKESFLNEQARAFEKSYFDIFPTFEATARFLVLGDCYLRSENLFQKMLTAELVYTQATEEFCF